MLQVIDIVIKKMRLLSEEKKFEFRQGIYYPTDLEQADFREGEDNRYRVLNKSYLNIYSQNHHISIGLGNLEEDMSEVKKKLRFLLFLRLFF